MRKICVAIVLAFLFVTVSRADVSLSGKWQGESRNKAPVTLILRVSDGALAGTFGRNDQSAEIKDGKIAANGFTFEATMNGRTERFSGEFTKDEVRLWVDRQGGESAIVLRRAKE
jgi:hypothetical protein